MAKRPHLTTDEIEELDLFDEMMDHLELADDELLEAIYTEGKDGRRRFTGSQRATVIARDGAACFHCGAEITGVWHADHVIPHSRGGRTVEENCVVACPSCNLKKSNRVKDWRRKSAPGEPQAPKVAQ